MKRIAIALFIMLFILCGCSDRKDPYDISPEAKADIESIDAIIYDIRKLAEQTLNNGTEGEERIGSLEVALNDIIYLCNKVDNYTTTYMIR